LKDLELNW